MLVMLAMASGGDYDDLVDAGASDDDDAAGDAGVADAAGGDATWLRFMLQGTSNSLHLSPQCHSFLTNVCRLASGLYYLSELEEHAVFTKKLLTSLHSHSSANPPLLLVDKSFYSAFRRLPS